MKVGQIIDGRWTIIEIKGRGGQGEVFKVSDSVTNSYYALKFLNKQNNIERRNRMFKEVCNVKCLSDCKFRFIGSPIPLATDQCFRS